MSVKSWFQHLGGQISSGFKKFSHTLSTGFTTVVKTLNKHVFQPIYKKVLEPGYNHIIKPIGQKTIGFITHSIDRVDRLADSSVLATEGLAKLPGDKTFTCGLLAIGGIVGLSLFRK